MKIRLGVVLLLMLAASSAVRAGQKVVTLATLDGYPPFCFDKPGQVLQNNQMIAPGQDAKGFQGYSWDVVRASFQAMGYSIRLQVTPWVRAMHSLKGGEVELLFPAGKNAQREKVFAYSKQSVDDVRFRIYVKSDSRLQWHGLGSLKGMTVGLVRGYNFGDAWDSDHSFHKYTLNSISAGFKMLDAGHLDAFAGYDVTWDYALSKMPNKADFKKLPPFGGSREYVVGMKRNPRVAGLLKVFDAGKRKIIADGTFAKIQARWR